MDMELEVQPPLMLKEWLELESSAELSRHDGFGCYPRHLVRNASGRRRSNGGDVIARVSSAVRAALLRAPSLARRAEEAGAPPLPRSLSRRLRAGFWKKRREEVDRPVHSCSATAAVACARNDGSSPPATSPRRTSWEGRRAGVGGAGIGNGRSHEAEVVAASECEAACRLLDEEPEQEQRLSPVSVMDFPGQDEHGNGNNRTDGDDDGDDETMSPTFARSVASIRRASQLLLQKIQQFEQLAELDPSDVDAATTATEDASCQVAESDVEDEAIQDLLGILQASSPVPVCRFQKLLEDFFRDGLASSPCRCERPADDPETAKSLLATAKSWLDGRHCTLRTSDWKADLEEIERLGWGRRFREDEHGMLAVEVEGLIFWSLVEELVDDLW